MSSKKTLYLECNSGISGDMMVASLLDLGADVEVLKKALDSLPIDGFEIKVSRIKKSALEVCDFDVILDEHYENHDHNMEYLHGEHDNNKEHMSEHKEHHHNHRGIEEINKIINEASITEHAKEIAIRIFNIIAESEAKAHGVKIEEVHFHEVGAVDSIVDIVSTAVCIDNLGITNVIVPEVFEGKGSIRCQHGILPIPVPAVVNIVSKYSIPMTIMDFEGEFVTPTGAAIIAALCTSNKLPEKFTINKIGMGAGKRKYEKASILRAMIIDEKTDQLYEEDIIYKLESNIDDCTGESLGYVMNLLFEAGARDVHYMPVYMKKNRPAYELVVICDLEHIGIMEEIIFKETTTIGIRKTKMERSILKREVKKINTSFGEIEVKICSIGDKVKYYPEYESLILLCKKLNLSYLEMYNYVISECIKGDKII